MTDNPILGMTPAQMLAAYDDFMSGKSIRGDAERVAKAVSQAAAYASTAYDMGMGGGQDGHALARSFLLALIDPLHADLDYLRADPASGAVERAKREKVNG